MKKQVIEKSNLKQVLSYEELSYFFNGYLKEEVSDEEMTILLRNICDNGLSKQEVFDLVDIFIKSGETLSLPFKAIDKHSTGGVGDKTTLIICSILASCGVKIAKMSGRALGHTGGTIDKLESLGIKVDLTKEEVLKQVTDIGMVISSQTSNLCPMDKKVYALRDVTSTTESIPLIAISIMSKKIASGADDILIDVKVGSGALVKNIKDAKKLANLMIEIGKKYNKNVICMLTRMDNPLGNNIGNSIEILEVLDVLQDKCRNNLYDLCFNMSSLMLSIYNNIKLKDAKEKVREVLSNNMAFNKFLDFVNYQGGSLKIELERPIEVGAKVSGYISEIDSHALGLVSMKLGAGRVEKDDLIDYNAGIIINKNVGDYVSSGEVLCKLYGLKQVSFEEVYKAFKISNKNPKIKKVIIKVMK